MKFLEPDNPIKFIEALEEKVNLDVRQMPPRQFLESVLYQIAKDYFQDNTGEFLKIDFIALKLSDQENIKNDNSPIVYPEHDNSINKSIRFRESYKSDVNISKIIFDKNSRIKNRFISITSDINFDPDVYGNSIIFSKNNTELSAAYNNSENFTSIELPDFKEPNKNKYYSLLLSLDQLENPEDAKTFFQKIQIEENKVIVFFSSTFNLLFSDRPLGLILQFSIDPLKDVEQKQFFIRFILYCSHLLTYTERYFLHRLTYQLDKTTIKSAINSILIDSYAHNISAHSLNFLQHLFNYRNENFLKKSYPLQQFGRLRDLPLNKISYSDFFTVNVKNKDNDANELIHYKALGISDSSNSLLNGNILDYIFFGNESVKDSDGNKVEANNLLKFSNQGNNSGKIPMPIDYAIAPLLVYLRDKGGFWSGIIRDNVATPSRIISFYDLIMEMFENALFIGSIMAAEKFFIIHVFITLEIETYKTPCHLLTINIKEFVESELEQKKNESADSVNPETPYKLLGVGHSTMNFLRLSEKHEDLRKILQELKILLPGGDVGKHAFFTIVENTLRNAKHIKNTDRQEIQVNGLELHFKVKGAKFDRSKSEESLYNIGINLNYRYKENSKLNYYKMGKQTSSDEFKQKQKDLFKKVILNSYLPILNEDGLPRMGGSSQDKVCAAALFNKTFTSVEYYNPEVKRYYPWIKYNLCPDNPEDKPAIMEHIQYEKITEALINDKSYNVHLELTDANCESMEGNESYNKGFIIKFFHVWKGSDVYVFDIESTKNENNTDTDEIEFIYTIPRFKISVTKDKNQMKYLRQNAVVRVIESAQTDIDFITAYTQWNNQWLKGCYTGIIFNKNGKIIQAINVSDSNAVEKGGNLHIKLDHDSGAENADVCKLRNHGQFLKNLLGGKTFGEIENGFKDINPLKTQELIETVLTRIFLIDNRLYNLLDNYTFPGKEKKSEKLFKEHLGLHLVSETLYDSITDLKEAIKNWGKNHFFIFHLSYVDHLIDITPDINKKEKKYLEFIRTVFDLEENDPKLASNQFFCMTTGRGRSEWLSDMPSNIRPQCLHYPIESLQTAIQQGVMFKDDFDIKYNLCKVLFGS